MVNVKDLLAAQKNLDQATRALFAYIEGSEADFNGYKRLVADIERAIEEWRKILSQDKT